MRWGRLVLKFSPTHPARQHHACLCSTWSRGTKFAELDGKYGSGTSKNNRILSECLKSLYLLCPTAPFAIQLGGFYTT